MMINLKVNLVFTYNSNGKFTVFQFTKNNVCYKHCKLDYKMSV